MFGCEIGRDRGLPIALPTAEGVQEGSRGRSKDSIAFNQLRGPLSKDVALSAPKSAVFFSGILPSLHPKVPVSRDFARSAPANPGELV